MVVYYFPVPLFFGAIIWFFMLFDKGQEDLDLQKAQKMLAAA